MRTERLALAALVLALAWVGAACSGAPCIRHSDCDPGLVCSPAGACLVPVEPDGGEADGGADASPDAGDAGDAGTDAGAPDGGGPPDAAVDAPPPTEPLESEAASPITDEMGLPHMLTPVSPRQARSP